MTWGIAHPSPNILRPDCHHTRPAPLPAVGVGWPQPWILPASLQSDTVGHVLKESYAEQK